MFLKQSLDSQGNFCWGLWSCFEHYIVRINRSAVNLTNSHTTVVLLVVCGCLSVIALTMANSYLSPPYPPSSPPPPTSCSAFLHCVFSNVSSNYLPEGMHNHTGCICLIFPCAQWQLFHWNSSASNYHAQGFVPSPTNGKVCPLLLLISNWENSNVKLLRKRKWKWN